MLISQLPNDRLLALLLLLKIPGLAWEMRKNLQSALERIH